MPILFRPLESAPEAYTREGETRFRRELENYLLRLSSEVNGASSAQSTEASLASKREALILASHGVTTYPNLRPLSDSHLFASVDIAEQREDLQTLGTTHWVTTEDGGDAWTVHESLGWDESNGEFTYTGPFPRSTGSRLFLVNYACNFNGWSTREPCEMKAVVQTNPNDTWGDVAGSMQENLAEAWVQALYVKVASHTMSCSSLVRLFSEGHGSGARSIRMRFGYYIQDGSGGTYSITYGTNPDGISLSIIPADNFQ